MIRTYRIGGTGMCVDEGDTGIEAAGAAAWIDLLEPTRAEEAAVERVIGAEIPTREEMAEIEVSSRMYMDGDAAVMTVPLLIRSHSDYPASTDVTFVLGANAFVTIRYEEPTSFANFAAALKRSPAICASPQSAFVGLLDAVVDRIADVLEEVGRELDSLSRSVFHERDQPRVRNFREHIVLIGRNGDIVSKARESLVGLSRIAAFARDVEHVRTEKAVTHRLRLVARDVEVLSEHVGYLASKITLLLDATLGMINIEQSSTIKMFSVVAVIFLPPTLIASIYGMNFRHMPELDWPFGYPLAIGAMVISMILPILWFKRKRWI